MVAAARDRELETATASMQVARAIVAAAAEYGHDPSALAARFGLTAAQLADPDGRIPARIGVALWEEVPRIVGDELFGLRLGQRASDVGAIPILGYVVQTSPTLGDGIERALRYQRLLQTLNPAELLCADAAVRLVVHIRARHVERLRHATEFALAFIVSFAARVTGEPLILRRVGFAHVKPSDLEEHRRIFGDDLRFDVPQTELEMHPAMLARPVLSADPQLCAVIERHAQALLERLPSSGSVTDRARAALVQGVRSGRTEVAAVAEGLRMSARTLQRRLSGEGTSYVGLLDSVRRDLALRYVADRTLSLSEVAFLVGFADQTTFHRAFVRWTGRTPGAFRKG